MPTPKPIVRFACVFGIAAAAAACDRPGPDEALYLSAHDAGIAHEDAEAHQLYRRLLRDHPNSRFKPDAHLALAELFFRRGELAAARAEYDEVLKFPEAKSWVYALYRKGQCLFSLGRPKEALAVFERIIELDADDRIARDRKASIVKEARRDLVRAYAKVHPADTAATYLERWSGGDAPALLHHLGDAYLELDKRDDAAAIFRELIAGHVDSPSLCQWQERLVRIALAGSAHREQVAEVQHLGAVLARLEKTAGVPPEELASCRTRLRDTLKELALTAHKRGQREASPAFYDVADPLYRQYLARFAGEKDAAAMAFYHAELLFTRERWQEAADEYRRALTLAPAGKHAREAAYGHLIATKNALQIDHEGRVAGEPAASDTTKPRAFSAASDKMLKAFDLYLTHVSEGPEAARVAFRRARMYYDHHQFEKAADLFRDFVTRHPGDDLAVFAVNLELDSWVAHGRNQVACTRARELDGGPIAAADPDLAATLRAIVKDCAGKPTAAQP